MSHRPWKNITVYRDGTSLIITGEPDDTEGAHDCDFMGCGQDHVIGRAAIAIADAHPVDEDTR